MHTHMHATGETTKSLKCFLKLHAREDAYYALHSHIVCTCLVFLQWYVFIRPKSDHCLALSLRHSLTFLNFVQIVGFVKVVSWFL